MSGTTANTDDSTGRTHEADARNRMLAGLPVTARTLDIDGIATSVLEGGDGPPLVLLHGGIECGGAMWAPVLTRLMEHHRVVVPDVPGLGESASRHTSRHRHLRQLVRGSASSGRISSDPRSWPTP